MKNRYPGRCSCGTFVWPRRGFIVPGTFAPQVRCAECATEPDKGPPPQPRLPYKDD